MANVIGGAIAADDKGGALKGGGPTANVTANGWTGLELFPVCICALGMAMFAS